eukprot:1195306-Prorocentrum_minimum.AAC.2
MGPRMGPCGPMCTQPGFRYYIYDGDQLWDSIKYPSSPSLVLRGQSLQTWRDWVRVSMTVQALSSLHQIDILLPQEERQSEQGAQQEPRGYLPRVAAGYIRRRPPWLRGRRTRCGRGQGRACLPAHQPEWCERV